MASAEATFRQHFKPRSPQSSTYRILEHPTELQVGHPLTITIGAPRERGNHDDWIGIFPPNIPSVPGVAQGRWLFVPRSSVGPITSDGSSTEMETLSLTFPLDKLPPHPGRFDIRIHAVDKLSLYEVVANSRFEIVRSPVSRVKRMIFLGMLGLLAMLFQAILNSKGICSLQDDDAEDLISDRFILLTKPINAFLRRHLTTAKALQALSSAIIDSSLISLFAIGALRRSTVRPFLALFVLMALRFCAQSLATFPCPSGFLWPSGALLGYPVPTLFVDYHPANDFFFSGHVGTIAVAAIEFAAMDYWRFAAFQLLVLMPCIATLVVSFRVHRGVDVYTALLAAITACSLVEKFVDPIDALLMKAEEKVQSMNSKSSQRLASAGNLHLA